MSRRSRTPPGIDWNIGAWRGIVGPKGMPADMRDQVLPAIKKILKAPIQRVHGQTRLRRPLEPPGREFEKYMEKSSNELGATMKAVGIVK